MWQALPDTGGTSSRVIDAIMLGTSLIKHKQGGSGQEMKHSNESNWLMLMGTNAWSGTGGFEQSEAQDGLECAGTESRKISGRKRFSAKPGREVVRGGIR